MKDAVDLIKRNKARFLVLFLTILRQKVVTVIIINIIITIPDHPARREKKVLNLNLDF